ncbi:MAG TPA: choice-of-anchor J domain-containing protein [Nocardioides sp.]|nr:choice-of-anchor J domain-containing protein [Nocardioides sp.]
MLRSSGDSRLAGTSEASGDCAPGYQPVEAALAEVRAEMRAEHSSGGEAADSEEAREEAEREEAEREEAESEEGHSEEGESEEDRELQREAVHELPMLAGTDPDDWDSLCLLSKRPESINELAAMSGARAMPRLAPYGSYAQGAGLNAIAQRSAMRAGSVPGTQGTAHLYGRGPLIVDDPAYPRVNGLGLGDNSGRIDSYAWDRGHHRLFAAVGNGGIWRSDDLAKTWTSASGNLPTSVTGAVAWSPSRGGTLLALTGEPTFGSSAYTGLGAYWSGDLGRHWTRSKGLPSGALGFALAVDKASPKVVYAATQLGLFRSADGGRSYRNVKLPTGSCAGVTDTTKRPRCALRNVVTDVVVNPGGKAPTTTKAGAVVATVGWRGGQKKNPDGSVQSPRNGVYRSGSGRPGTFKKLEASGFADQDAIGRVELGNAVGPQQDHDFLYALVQDANLLNNGGVAGIDAPEGAKPPVGGTVLNGLYVSGDFGTTWTLLAKGTELAADPLSGSALIGTGTATGYQPGVQGWYNLWVQPDPTRQTPDGIPTRMAFGLEEIWSNDLADQGAPLDGSVPAHFRVVGKYFGGGSCLMLNTGLPTCPGDREPTDNNQTTHPDQQDGIWIPDASVENGGVQLVVGNDGGSYRYRFEDDSDAELDNSHWGRGDQTGLSTLMPYYAAMAKDGTVWAGLQDNGNLKIDGTTRKQYETFGGDGFFAAVDPNDSKTAYEEYTNGAISVTTDGGTSWKDIDPGLTSSKFSNPFTMDPTDPEHLITAGREVVETLVGSSTDSGQTPAADADSTTTTWRTVYDLGTRSHPGDADATSSATDPDNSMSAVAVRGAAAYVGFCGHCDTLNKLGASKTLFKRGLATNVGTSTAPQKGTAKGWHIVPARGLPNRYITSIAIDPANRKHVFVTLGGYTRRWLPPGAVGDANKQLGTGHLFASRDGGRSFRNVTGNLPDSPATWVTLRGNQLLVATDVGAFASSPMGAKQATPRFAPLGGLPAAPVASISLRPGHPKTAVLAMFGRGVWTYQFAKGIPVPPPPAPSPTPTVGSVYKAWDFESGAQSWTADGLPTTWSQGSPGHGADSAGNDSGSSWAIAGPTGYVDNMDASLVSPAQAVPGGDTVLQWWSRMDTEGGFDFVEVEWSTDGSTWKPLGTFSGKNEAYPGWSRYAVGFDAPSGDVQVRFHFTSDSLCSALGGPLCSSVAGWDGVRVDDVTLGSPGS